MWKKRTFQQTLVLEVAVGVLVFVVLVALLVHVEKASAQASIVDYPSALWYAIVSLTGVGYGDLYPATTYGRIIGYIFVLLSIGIYVLFIGNISALMASIRRSKKLGHQGTSFTGHAIIIGWNEIAHNVANELIAVHKKVAIITDSIPEVDIIREKYRDFADGVYVLQADYASQEALEKTNIVQSNSVFINLKNDMDKLVYLLDAKKLYGRQKYVVILENAELKSTFLSAGASHTVSKNEMASKLLASYIFEPDVAEYSESILSHAENETDYDIKQYRVIASNHYINREYNYAYLDLKKRLNIVLIGISKEDKTGTRILIKNPAGSVKIEEGDYLIMILNGRASGKLEDIFNITEGV